MSVACKAQLNAFALTARHPYINHIAIQHIHRTFATYRDTNSGINNVSKIPSSSSTVSPRKKVTVINDDGRVPWAQLTAREKVARTTQQSFNLAIVVAGLVATGAVITFLYWDVFSPDSKTSIFNRAVARIKKDQRCLDLLGDSGQISAFGEGSWSRWARNRFIASQNQKDKLGNEHMYMHFNVEGPLNKGIVSIHLTKAPNQSRYQYKYLALDVPGHERLYLEKAYSNKAIDRSSGKLFGVRWW